MSYNRRAFLKRLGAVAAGAIVAAKAPELTIPAQKLPPLESVPEPSRIIMGSVIPYMGSTAFPFFGGTIDPRDYISNYDGFYERLRRGQ